MTASASRRPDAPAPTDRAALLAALDVPAGFDVAVVGGGATGLGVALDAAARGFSVALVEAGDFACGTSSRATKLVHGGVRYLAQGNVSLVREALRERAALLHNAPHLAAPIAFVMPAYRWWERSYYGAGLALYDRLAGAAGLGRTRRLDRDATLRELPGARAEGLRGGVLYWDGQFEDARLALALARSAARQGAVVANHVAARGLLTEDGRVRGVRCEDRETGRAFDVRARAVINATGVWVDGLRAMDAAAADRDASLMVSPSQGVHLVVDRAFLPGRHALLVPATADGRVLFAVPWLGATLLGTTDTPRERAEAEPRPLAAEVDFILGEAGRYLARAPTRADVRSSWVGLRPLVRPGRDTGDDGAGARDTRRISREHTVTVSPSGLVSVTGGKWTTYRAMAEDVLACCAQSGLLPARPAGVTRTLRLVGANAEGGEPSGSDVAPKDPQAAAHDPDAAAHDPDAASPHPDVASTRPGPQTSLADPPGLHLYGTDAPWVRALPGADVELAPGLTEAMVRFAVRHEYARTVEDVLARRSRLLFLDAALAGSIAAHVALIIAHETGGDPRLAEFSALARAYGTLPG